jgi:NDP-sugar pyrophosphorylase family protein
LEAVVLAGGLGTRLRRVIGDRPKVIADVAGRPFIERVLERLRRAGIRRALLCTGFGGEEVERTLGDGSRLHMQLRYAREPEPLGTGGALRLATTVADLVHGSSLVLNGDSVVTLDLPAFFAQHRNAAAIASVALAKVPDRARFGEVTVGCDGRIVAFREKGGDGPGWVNAGIYLFEREVLDAIPTGRPVSLEREVLPALPRVGVVLGIVAPGPLVDIGTPASFRMAQHLFARDRKDDR